MKMVIFQELKEFTPEICNFGFSLLREFAFEERENVIISPFSISTALAMTVLGAVEDSKHQILNAMNMTNVSDEELQKYFLSLINDALTNSSSCILRVANGAFVEKKYNILERFSSILKEYFNAKSKEVDFSDDQSRQSINQWVEQVSNSKIKDLLGSGTVDEYTRLILVNAIYFKGLWKIPFKPELTNTTTFHLSSTETVEVEMMHINSDFNYTYSPDLHCSCIQLPYEANDLFMVILLPDEIEGLTNLESVIDFDALRSILDSCSKSKVKLSLPKFKIESSLTLEKSLQKLGIIDIFTDAANLSGINGNKELQVSSIIHKSFLEVNEEGTEAAAATAVIVRNKRCIITTIEFIVNHPFMLLILNRNSGNILFTGKILKL